MGQINEFKRKNMKIEINCSQELLEKSKYCGTGLGGVKHDVVSKCWIALAVQEVFPNSQVNNHIKIIFEGGKLYLKDLVLDLPVYAKGMIRDFDACDRYGMTPEQTAELRLEKLNPFTFEIELTEEQENILLENISLPDLTECFAKSRHLTLTV